MIIAELTVVPLGTQTPSVSRYVTKAVSALRKLGLEPQVTAMGTIIEAAELPVILEAVRTVHESVFEQGALRVVTTLKIDERRDKAGSIEQKLKAVRSGYNGS
ncbi:MAG TPA: MTH1187 family thiamine-binding protein [Methanomicrobia archaeon]|nr:MTH1187 family thiamine-binding protein [Methanomicrobia archaeon]